MSKPLSGSLATFAILNIFVCLAAPCAGCIGVTFFTSDPAPILIKGRDVGPAFHAHLNRTVPHAKFEAIGALVGSSFVSMLLIIGSVGLFSAANWARWLTIGSALLMILCFCVHDVYQLGVFRPAVMTFLDQNMGNMPGPEREGFKIGFTATFFMWSCTNPIFILYLGIMCLSLLMSSAFQEPERSRRRRRRDEDEDDDDDY